MPTENGAATRAERPTQTLKSPTLKVDQETVTFQLVCWDCLDKLWYRGLQPLKPLFWGIKIPVSTSHLAMSTSGRILAVELPLFDGDPSESLSWMVLHTGHRIERLA
jgi:hypothetical protein